jgi:hypothetical protein
MKRSKITVLRNELYSSQSSIRQQRLWTSYCICLNISEPTVREVSHQRTSPILGQDIPIQTDISCGYFRFHQDHPTPNPPLRTTIATRLDDAHPRSPAPPPALLHRPPRTRRPPRRKHQPAPTRLCPPPATDPAVWKGASALARRLVVVPGLGVDVVAGGCEGVGQGGFEVWTGACCGGGGGIEFREV